MILVFLFLAAFILIAIFTSSFRIEIGKISVYVGDVKIRNKNLLIENNIFLGLYLFNKIRIWRHSINSNNIIAKKKLDNKIKSSPINKKSIKEIVDVLKKEKVKLNLNAKIGTSNVIITSYIISALATTISFIEANLKNKKSSYNYIIKPIYENMQNIIKIELNGIICIKIVHIISIIKIFNKGKRVNKYERTSYRRINDDSDEQHRRYG